nr:erythroblast NAD(P)(+)--arginine ADP-ribosyltransferase-like [Pogona vitticeps]
MHGIQMEERQCVALFLITFLVWPAQGVAMNGYREMSKSRSNPVLNMAHSSLDDQYDGCLKNMKENLTSLLRIELGVSKSYKEAWENALLNCQYNRTWMYPRNLEELSEVAICTYTQNDPPFYSEFNAATRKAGKGPREYADYRFKSLHFLLTYATRFWRREVSCQRVYRGTKVNFSIGQYFRFGQFTSTSEKKKVASFFGKVTFFNLVSCKGIDINEVSSFRNEEEVLIPPYEIFEVKSVNDTVKGKTVHAVSAGSCSNHNCLFMGEGSKKTKGCDDHQVLHF